MPTFSDKCLDVFKFKLRYFGSKPRVFEYISRYSQANDVVFDPFAGMGTITVQALAMERRAIYNDLNPVAYFAFKTIVEASSSDLCFRDVIRAMGDVLRCLVATVRDRREGLTKINVEDLYLVNDIPARFFVWNGSEIEYAVLVDGTIVRSSMGDFTCSFEPLHYSLAKLYYESGVPFYTRRSVDDLAELFSRRNFIALKALYEAIERKSEGLVRDLLKVAFLYSLYKCSRMQHLSGGSWPVPKYWVPRRHIEYNPLIAFRESVKRILNVVKSLRRYLGKVSIGDLTALLRGEADLNIINRDARYLDFLPDASVDYIITDPPMVDEVQYLELSYFYAVWLGLDMPFSKEFIVNPKRGQDFEYYMRCFRCFISDAYRVLKDDGFLTLIIHDVKGLYRIILDIAREHGFKLVGIDTKVRFRGMNARLSMDRELYITFGKH